MMAEDWIDEIAVVNVMVMVTKKRRVRRTPGRSETGWLAER